MNGISNLIGREVDLPQVTRAIRLFAENMDASTVGGYHITCSDESEWECSRVFGRLFGQELLPRLKMDRAAVFRTMNLGARYEQGAVHIAEHHYATFDSQISPKVMVVKVNSHAAVFRREEGHRYGTLKRYGNDSACCGALSSLMQLDSIPQGGRPPALNELAEQFGPERLAELQDERQTPPEHRALLTAVLNARLQADRVVNDIQTKLPATPTVYVVLPCVTINRDEPDNEIVIGQYGIDATGNDFNVKYQGLGDSPRDYRLKFERGLLHISDSQWAV